MISLSVVIPMYNVESHVERCLRSLEDQDFPKGDYEIICVNDGSPDNSRGVVMCLQKEFSNIILIDQENQGVSRARNNGIDKANGKYILFIDPDDYVDPNCFGRILKKAEKGQAQVSFLGFTFLYENGTVYKRIFNENLKSQCFIGTKAYFIARGDGRVDPDRMWAVLFESKFLNSNNLRYLPDVPFLEDGEFIARILCVAERCIFDGYSFYQRTSRPGSATNSSLYYSEKATMGFLLAARNLKNFQKRPDLNCRQKEFLDHTIAKFSLLAVNSSLGWKRRKRLVGTISKLIEMGLRKIKPSKKKRYYIINGVAYNISPYLGAVSLFIYLRISSLYHNFLK